MKSCCIYILASKYNGALYIGVTSNLVKHADKPEFKRIRVSIIKALNEGKVKAPLVIETITMD